MKTKDELRSNTCISRSEFLVGGMLGLLGIAGVGSLSGCASSSGTAANSEAALAQTGKDEPSRIIDAHSHLLPSPMNTDYVNWLQQTKTMEDGPFFLWTDTAFEDVQNHLDEMDRFGIDSEIVTFSSNIPNILKATGSEGPEAISALNDGLQSIADSSNGRIIPCAWIDPASGESAVAEMNRVAENGAKAFGILTGYSIDGGTHYMDYPTFEPFWAQANKLGLPVFTHFSTRFPINDPDVALTGFSTENVMNGGISVLVENTVAATRLVYSGILDKYPDLKIVLGQLGGFFPWMFGRYDLMYGIYSASGDKQGVDYKNKENLETYLRDLRDYAPFFYYDSHSMGNDDIECALGIVGADHLMFGSDYPITAAKLGRELPLGNAPSFPDQESKELFYHGSIEKLLGI